MSESAQPAASWGNRWLDALARLNRRFCCRYHRLAAEPLPLPAAGPALLVANHLSGLDALLLLAASPRPLRFIIAKEQYHRFGLQWLFRAIGCIPVDRHGRPERAFRVARKVLAAGEVVALFPEGGIHPAGSRPKLKPGVARLAHLAGAPVCAVYIDGIGRPGTIFRSLLRRSRARLTSAPAISCEALPSDECLLRIAAVIQPEGPQATEKQGPG